MSQDEYEQGPIVPMINFETVTRQALRDQFAMAALTGLLAMGADGLISQIHYAAYRHADGMLEARKVKP